MASFPTDTRLNDVRQFHTPTAQEFEHLYAQLQGYLSREHHASGRHTDITADSVVADTFGTENVTFGTWKTPAFSRLTFTASSGNWTVTSGDVSYVHYAFVSPTQVQIKGSILTTTVSATPTELRLAMPDGFTFDTTGNDSFGVTVYTEDSFATQALGQVIARAANNWLAFKKGTGAAWATTTDNTGVIFNLLARVKRR